MKPLTIKDLLKALIVEHEKGHDDYVVFVTDDEEANGYHALWYYGETPEEMTEVNKKWAEGNNCDISVLENKNKAYYIG